MTLAPSLLMDQLLAYINANWPIEPLNPSNLFANQDEIDNWVKTIPENLRNRVYDSRNKFHPVKLLMLLDPKTFWTEAKRSSQRWDDGVGFRTGLTLTQGEPGKVQLVIAIDSDDVNTRTTLERIIKQYNLKQITPIQETPHGGLHVILCTYVDPNDLETIAFWEKRKSLSEGAGCWLNGAECAIKINCQQITLFPTPHRKDGSMYKLNKVMPLLDTTWAFDIIIQAFISDGLLECSPESYHAKLEEKERDDSREPFDNSEWFTLTDDEINNSVNIILGDTLFKSIYYDGCRHNNTMPISGSLAWAHISQESTERFFEVLMERVDDDEPDDRLGVVNETYQRITSVPSQNVQGRNVMIELFRTAHKDRDVNTAADRFEEFRHALGLNHKKLRKNVTVSECLRLSKGVDVRVRDCIISGAHQPEKMIAGITARCLQCNTLNILRTRHRRPYFAWELDTLRDMIKQQKCINCTEGLTDIDSDEINGIQIEVQDSGTLDDLKFLRVVLLNDASDNVLVGEDVVLTGFTESLTIKGSRVLFLFVGYEDDSTLEYRQIRDDSSSLTPEEEIEIAKYIADNGDNILNKMVEEFAISIIGDEYEKKATILSMNMAAKDSVQLKTRINVIYVGDPGLAKSPLIRCAIECVPRSRFVSGINASIRSDIAIVDKDGPNAVFRPGPVIKASGALCGMDEIGRMSYEDQAHLLSAVNEGKIHFGKHGFNRELDASATFLLSANPSGGSGHWNNEEMNLHQIPVLGALLDRIDLVLMMETKRDVDHLRNYAKRKIELIRNHQVTRELELANHKKIGKRFQFCKRFSPELSEDAASMVGEFYVNVASAVDSKTSPRLLNTLYNLCISLAKLKGKNVVDAKDATEVMEFFKIQCQYRTKIELEIPKDPFEITKNLIISAIEGKDCYYIFNELLTNLYDENESVKDYFGDKLILSTKFNRKYRRVREWVEGDNKIQILSKSPLKIAWIDSYKDSRGGKRDGSGRPNSKEDIQNNLSNDIQTEREGDMVTSPKNNFMQKTEEEPNLEKSENQMTSPVTTSPLRGTLNIDTKKVLDSPYTNQTKVVPKIAKPQVQQIVELEAVHSVPQYLIEQVPELKTFKAFDFEWEPTTLQIYAYRSVDQDNYITKLHLQDDYFKGDEVKFVNSILNEIETTQTLIGYSISLVSRASGGRDDIDGDLQILSNMCVSLKLTERLDTILSHVKIIDSGRLFGNDAVKGALEQDGIKYKGYKLNAVSKAILGIGKFEDITGSNVASKDMQTQLDYCLRDAQLAVLILQKDNYDILGVLYDLSKYIGLDLFSTINSTGPSAWWRHKLFNKSNYHYPPYEVKEYVDSKLYDEKGKKIQFKFTGGKVFPTKLGIYIGPRTYDFSSMYPSQINVKNLSSETIGCLHPEHKESCKVPQEIMDMVNLELKEPRPWDYWVCPERGILPNIMKDLVAKKQQYKREGKKRPEKAMKLFLNSGYGVMKFLDIRINDLTTAYSRYTLIEISKMLEDKGCTIISGDTDSIFTHGGNDVDSIIEEAMERFGITFSLDKVWNILFILDIKKQYFGILADGSLYHTTVYGMKDHLPAYFNDVMYGLITKDILQQFIDVDNRSSILEYVEKYVISAYKELEQNSTNLEFCKNKLTFSELAEKHLYDYKTEDEHWRAFNEALEDCNGDKALAQELTEKGRTYPHWKILTTKETKSKKKGIIKIKKVSSTTTFHLERHYQDIDIQKYKNELWTCFESILKVFGLDTVSLANELGVKVKKKSKKSSPASVSN